MSNFELFDFVLFPIGFLTEYRFLTWPALCVAALWLYYRRISKSGAAGKLSLVIWRFLLCIAIVAIVCVLALVMLSSNGPDFYRVAICAISAVPLVLPALLCYPVRPRARTELP